MESNPRERRTRRASSVINNTIGPIKPAPELCTVCRPTRNARISLGFLLALAGIWTEELGELIRNALERIGIGRRVGFTSDIRPGRRILAIGFNPLLGLRIAVRNDRFGRAFGLANAAIDAFVGMDDQHVLALVETIHGANLDAVHVFALDAGFGHDIGHRENSITGWESPLVPRGGSQIQPLLDWGLAPLSGNNPI